jgi:hypothetical protein
MGKPLAGIPVHNVALPILWVKRARGFRMFDM